VQIEDEKLKGWHSCGYLPHFDGGGISQFVTFRLHDSMPQHLLKNWREQLEKEIVDDIEAALRRRIEIYFDKGFGSCYLQQPKLISMVQDALLFHDGNRYRLSAWVITPNHVHFLATPCKDNSLSDIMHSIKSFTSHEADKLLNRNGHFWQEDYFDRYIRDNTHFTNVIEYIEYNPVKAKLCKRKEDWLYSSAYFRMAGE